MWLDQPQTEGSRPMTPLLRPRSGGQVEANLTGEPLRCFVHFAANRSWPCTGHKCCLCKRSIPKRCYAYYPVMNDAGRVAILELTAQAENQLISQMEDFSHVPCGQIKLKRAGGRRNLPTTVEWTEPTNNKDRGSTEPDEKRKRGGYPLDQAELKRALMRIWKLPTRNGSMEEKEYLEKLNEAIRLQTEPRK